MNGRKMIGAAAMVAVLSGGAAIGAVTGMPGVSGAQGDTTASTETTAPTTNGAEGAGEDAGARHGGHPLLGMKVDAAAEAIGITEDDLKAALKDGQTLAQIAEANGVDRQTVVDALVEAGEAQLDELRETLPERMDEAMDRVPGSHRNGERGERLRELLGN